MRMYKWESHDGKVKLIVEVYFNENQFKDKKHIHTVHCNVTAMYTVPTVPIKTIRGRKRFADVWKTTYFMADCYWNSKLGFLGFTRQIGVGFLIPVGPVKTYKRTNINGQKEIIEVRVNDKMLEKQDMIYDTQAFVLSKKPYKVSMYGEVLEWYWDTYSTKVRWSPKYGLVSM